MTAGSKAPLVWMMSTNSAESGLEKKIYNGNIFSTINRWVTPQEIVMQLWDGVDQRAVNKSRSCRIQAWWVERSSIGNVQNAMLHLWQFHLFVNDFEQPTSSPVTLAIFCPVTSSMVRPILPTCKFCFKCSMFQHQVYWVYYLFTLSQGYN